MANSPRWSERDKKLKPRAGPMELVAILEALKEAGALHAELIVI